MKEIFHHCECLGRDFTREEWGDYCEAHPRGWDEPVASFGKFEFNMAATEAIGFDHDILGEFGDILWQLTGLCDVLQLSLDDVAQHNIDKLASRQSRGVIDGDGDDR